jgi:small-conductance mechanosensitive channel
VHTVVKNKNFILFSFLILLIILSTFIPVGSVAQGTFHTALQVLKGFLITLEWFTFYYLIKISIFSRYKQVYKKSVPRIILIMTRFLVFVGAYLSVVVFVLNQSILSFVALGGLLSAGLTFALGELILDAFAGVILETESLFQINDWIKTHEDDEGKVVKINWRTVVLENLEGHLIVVPHRTIAQGFVNYSKPERNFWDSMEINLDQRIPVKRAERILRAAVLDVASIHHKQCEIGASRVSEKGITYEIIYPVPDLPACRRIKHDVIESVTRHLHDYGIKICEYIGEYTCSPQDRPLIDQAPVAAESLLRKIDFLKTLSPDVFIRLSESVQCQSFNEGEKIVREGEEGQSLFLIAEGMVEVSIAYTSNGGAKKEKKLFRMSYPDYFGEMALFLNEKRSATVTALTNVLVYEISQDIFKAALEDTPEIFPRLVKQAQDKKAKNQLTKTEMEKLKEKKIPQAKGLLTNIKKFFK